MTEENNIYKSFVEQIEDRDLQEKLKNIDKLSDVLEELKEEMIDTDFSECLTGAILKTFNPEATIVSLKYKEDQSNSDGLLGFYGQADALYAIIARMLDEHPWMVEKWILELEEFSEEQKNKQKENKENNLVDQVNSPIKGKS